MRIRTGNKDRGLHRRGEKEEGNRDSQGQEQRRKTEHKEKTETDIQ